MRLLLWNNIIFTGKSNIHIYTFGSEAPLHNMLKLSNWNIFAWYNAVIIGWRYFIFHSCVLKIPVRYLYWRYRFQDYRSTGSITYKSWQIYFSGHNMHLFCMKWTKICVNLWYFICIAFFLWNTYKFVIVLYCRSTGSTV